ESRADDRAADGDGHGLDAHMTEEDPPTNSLDRQRYEIDDDCRAQRRRTRSRDRARHATPFDVPRGIDQQEGDRGADEPADVSHATALRHVASCMLCREAPAWAPAGSRSCEPAGLSPHRYGP